MTQLLVKYAPFNFSEECIQVFDTLKCEMTQAPVMIKPDWSLPFKIMCDASDYAVGAVLGQRIDKHFKPIHYASKTMNEAQENYTTTKKELLVVVFAFDKFRQYLVLSKTIVFTDHSTLRYLFTKQDAKPRLIRWILLLQEFNIEIHDKKGAKNLAAGHLSRLENPDLRKLTRAEIRDLFPEERLMAISDKNNEPWCSWCGGPFNGGNCWHCTNVSFGDEFVCNPNPISNVETPDFSYPPSQPQTSSLDQFHCFECKDPLEDGVRYQRCTCKRYGYALREGFCWVCPSRDENLSIDAPNPNSFNDLPNVFTHPPQPQYETYSFELCGNDSHYGYDCLPRFPLPSRHFNFYDDDDYEESTIPLNEIVSQIPPSIAIIPVLPTLEPEDSLIMGDEHLSTIPEKESDEFIKPSVEDLVPILSEFEDTSESDRDCDLPSCDDFSSIDVARGNSMTFSNPLFDSNDDFTSSDAESLSDEDILKDNVKIYSNPLFEFDDEYISSDINPLFDEVLEDIENKDPYDSNLDEPTLLVTPLFNFNEDECFDPGGDVDEIELLLHHNTSPPKMSVASILEGFTDEPPLKENDDLFDLESKENEWKKILYDAPIDDLMTEDKVFDPEIHENFFSPTYVSLPFKDHHYLSLTYVIRIFLPYFTLSIWNLLFLLSFPGSEDIHFC
ncbi:gag-pol polyprotein [Tanacetum coccineum]|uniref:Gag-pol polyprotein n=1 Tax=Tanacetum coccineum TaxID=301880 RepID=A0ABQ5I810_9ASTR